MLAPIEAALKTALETAVTGWPLRWVNDQWPVGTEVSEANLPVNTDGTPAACIEADVIANRTERLQMAAASDGKRSYHTSGTFRVWLIAPQGSGVTVVGEKADAVEAAFIGQTVLDNQTTGQRLVMADTVIPPESYEDGDRFVRPVYVNFDFYYRA